MTRSLAVLALSVLVAAPSFAATTISKDDLKKLLKDNPDLILDVLKENRKEFFDIVQQAAQEEQASRQKEEEEAEQKDFEDSFKNPKTAVLDSKTHIRGKKSAKYTLVEYSDFQCPYCGRGFQTVEELRKKYGDKLRFIFKDKPLPFHPQAMPAAKWFEAVALQSPEKAWQFHDTMFQNQQKLGDDFFKQTVKDLGLNADKAAKDAESKAVADKIAADMAEADKLGFTGTPGFLLNGIPIRGAYPIERFDEIINRLNGGKPKEAAN